LFPSTYRVKSKNDDFIILKVDSANVEAHSAQNSNIDSKPSASLLTQNSQIQETPSLDIKKVNFNLFSS
jgi:hypothetical protein